VLRKDLQALARIRLREAKILLENKEWCGAYYLTGIGVECAIKSCIAKHSKRYEFPNKERAHKCFDHNLGKLIGVAGLNKELDAEIGAHPAFSANWGIVKDWNVEIRYEHGVNEPAARDIYRAVAARKYGVMAWLRRFW